MEITIDEDVGLLLAHPKGVFDMNLAEEIVHFVEVWEVARQEGFDRFCDLTGLDAIRLSASDIRQIATRRRLFNPNQVPVRSAFLAETTIAFATVAIYQDLLKSPRITVRSFRSIADASGWLRVDPRKLRS
jgi:hypothetical protein